MKAVTVLILAGFAFLFGVAVIERMKVNDLEVRVMHLEMLTNMQDDIISSVIDSVNQMKFKPIPPGRQKIGD